MVKWLVKRTYTIACLFCLLIGPSCSLADFRVLKPGLEVGEVGVQSGVFASELAVLRLDPSLWTISVYSSVEPVTAMEACKYSGSFAAINANFFGKDLRPLGLIISQSKMLHPIQLGGKTLTGIFLKEGTEYKIIFRDEFIVSNSIKDGIQSGPRLIMNGRVTPIQKDSPTRRSAIAIDRKGKILLLASKDRFPGLTLIELQKTMLAKELDIKDALNLDGGGSSQLYIDAKEANFKLNISGGDKVPVFLTVNQAK